MSSKKQSAPPAPAPLPDPTAQANALVNAQISAMPRAAQLQYDINANPQYGLLPTTQLQESVRRSVFEGETGVRDQLLQNILQSLLSPTGLTPEQQAAITARRGQAQNEYVTAQRNRANLGGGLYGGIAAQDELRGVADLQNMFAEQDITRDITGRQNALQAAMQALGLLYPGAQVVNPSYINPVQGADTYASSLLGQRGQDVNLRAQDMQAQQAQQAARSQLQSSLFGALGTAGGMALGGPLGASLGSSLFGGGGFIPGQSSVPSGNPGSYNFF